MLTLLAGFWASISSGAAIAWRAVLKSQTLQILIGLALFLWGANRVIKQTKKAGIREGERRTLDRIEEETRNAVRKIEEKERKIERQIGPAPIYEDEGGGEGLTTDDYNAREYERLKRLRRYTETDPDNRRNPREDPDRDLQ